MVALIAAVIIALAAQPALAATVDAGFENGADGAALAAPWTLSGVPQHAEYDTARAIAGAKSGWITGPTTAGYAGVYEAASAGMTSSGAEQRFWVYVDTANQYRQFDDFASSTADRAFTIQLDTLGQVLAYTNRTGVAGYTANAYTAVGTYAAGWTEFRVVYDFSTQTYQLSKRTTPGGAWTQLKASGATGYGIPMRGVNTVTQSHGLLARAYQNANLWLDEVAYDNAGIIETDVYAPSAPGTLLAADAAADQGGRVDLSWTAASDNVAVTAYKVYRGTTAGSYGAPVTLPVSSTSYTDSGLSNGTRYYYAVAAVDAAGNEGPKSAESSAIPADNLAPAVPSGLAATGGDKSVALSWTANADSDLAGYNVYRNGAKANTALVTGTTYTDTGRADGTTYTYTLKAVDVNGNESLASASATATTTGTAATLDGTFETGTDGAALAAPWVVSGTPQRTEFDNARAKAGALSAWIQGPAAASYGGVGETVSGGMSSTGAEQRFWVYMDTANQYRQLDDWSASTADRAFTLQFDTAGNVNAYTNRTGVAGYAASSYTAVGTYSAGWTEYRIVYDFASQTYQLSKRTVAGGTWTQMKAAGASGYGIPFRGVNTVTSSHGMLLRAYNGAQMWIDDYRFDNAGITDGPAADTTAPSAPTALAATDKPGDQGGALNLTWTAATDNVAVTGYKLYRGTSAGVWGAPVSLPVSASYTDAGCVTGTRYYYAISAIDAAGNESALSTVADAVAADNLAPAAPTGLTAVGGTKVATLSWTANAESDLAGYNVYRNGVKVNVATVTSASFTDSGLADSTTYAYTVKAVDAAGNESAASAAANATTNAAADTTPPAAPTGLVASGATKSATLSWAANAESDLAGYNVYRNGAKANASLVTATSFTDSGLADGTTYAYTVKAVDAAGNESAASASASATTAGTPSAFDGTFESGSDGAALAAPWIVSGAPQRFESDSARAKNGTLSGWIQGPSAAAYAGGGEKSSVMTANGAEQRFWAYCDTNNQYRVVDDWSATTADRVFSIQLSTDGKVYVYTNRTGNPNGYATNAYTSVGTYAVGWTEYRIVYDFSAQTYTLSKRSNATDAWTQLKAAGATGYAIPFRGVNTIASSHGMLFRGYQNANMWLDDVRYSNTGISDGPTTFTVTASAGSGGSISPAGAQTVNSGANSPQFTIAPNSGYKISDVLVDGTSVGTPSTYTFTNVTANHTIAASFSLLPVSDDMSLATVDCDTCHTSHGEPNCGDCHDLATYHAGTPTDMHVAADVTNCTPCHKASLTKEHFGRKTAAGADIECATCHQSTDPAVTGAITLKNSACVACHPTAGHPDAHLSDVASAPLGSTGKVCGDCHDRDIQVEHAKSSSTVTAAACANCHPTPRNTLVTWSGGCVDGGCHVAASASAMHSNESTAHAPASGTTCFDCHTDLAAKSLEEIHVNATTTVGGQTVTSCMVCHAAGVPATKTCSAEGCHADKTGSHQQVPTAHAAGTDAAVRVARTSPGSTAPRGGCSDTPASVSYDGYGQAIWSAPQVGCHSISNIAKLHEELPGKGCALCHNGGKTPKSECLDCHKEGGAIDTMPMGSQVYHHFNKMFLNDPSDVRNPGDKVFLDANANGHYIFTTAQGQEPAYNITGDSPTHGWNDSLFIDHYCNSVCHGSLDSNKSFSVVGGLGTRNSPYGALASNNKYWDMGISSNDTNGFQGQDRTITYNSNIGWTEDAPPVLTFTSKYQLGTPEPWAGGPSTAEVQISNDYGSTWTTLTDCTIDGAAGAIAGTSPGYTTGQWVNVRYDLASQVETYTTQNPIYDYANPVQTWDSWVPMYLRTPENEGKYFDTYDPLMAELHPEYDWLWMDYCYMPFQTTTYPITGYTTQVHTKPFKLRFKRHDCGRYYAFDWGWQFKDVSLKSGATELISPWAATYANNWTISDPRNYADPGYSMYEMSRVQVRDETVGDGSGPMWYTGSGTLGDQAGSPATRILELKDAVYAPQSDWDGNGGTTLEFDSHYWLQGEDSAKVEYSTDDGQTWNTLNGTALPQVRTAQDPDPSHWIWHEPWTDPDFGETYPGYWEKPIITLPAPEMTRSIDNTSGAATYNRSAANADGWVHEKYDISFGTNVKIRFVYTNGHDSGAWGWGVNNVQITTPTEALVSKAKSADPATWNSTAWNKYSGPGKMWYSMPNLGSTPVWQWADWVPQSYRIQAFENNYLKVNDAGEIVSGEYPGTWTSTGHYDYVPEERCLTLKPTYIPEGTTKLTFATWYSFGNPNGYYGPESGMRGTVEVSEDQGASWTPITGTVDGVSMASIEPLTKSAGWVNATYDLSAYAGLPVQVRFRLVAATPGGEGNGWGIDNVAIHNVGQAPTGWDTTDRFYDDIESANDAWTTSPATGRGWMRTSTGWY